jgi:hypothetical protein
MTAAAKTASFETFFRKYMVDILCCGIDEVTAPGRRA